MQPEEVFIKVRDTYGNNIDIRLLWKFTGAIEGRHWKLIEEKESSNYSSKLGDYLFYLKTSLI